jgi:hypothetical protein
MVGSIYCNMLVFTYNVVVALVMQSGQSNSQTLRTAMHGQQASSQ